MGKFEKRSQVRHKALVPAFASDLDETFQLRCFIRDFSDDGCQLVTSRVCDIPDVFHLTPEGFDLPLCARVMWRDRKSIGARLSSEDPSPEAVSAGALLTQRRWNDDRVLVLGDEKGRPLSYLERMKVYFSPSDPKPLTE